MPDPDGRSEFCRSFDGFTATISASADAENAEIGSFFDPVLEVRQLLPPEAARDVDYIATMFCREKAMDELSPNRRRLALSGR